MFSPFAVNARRSKTRSPESRGLFFGNNVAGNNRSRTFGRSEKISPGINVEDVFKVNLMILEVISENAETQLAGVVAVADFTGFEWRKHYQYLSPYYAKKSADVVQVSERTGWTSARTSGTILPGELFDDRVGDRTP